MRKIAREQLFGGPRNIRITLAISTAAFAVALGAGAVVPLMTSPAVYAQEVSNQDITREYLRKEIDYKNTTPLRTNEDYSKDLNKSIDYIKRATIEGQNFVEFIGYKGQAKDAMEYLLRNHLSNGASFLYVNEYKVYEEEVDGRTDVVRNVIEFKYLDSLKHMRMTEEKISRIVDYLNKKLAGRNSELDKARIIYDYLQRTTGAHVTHELYKPNQFNKVWVMGNEGEGMRRLTREHCDMLVSIPMFGTVESMNVSVSAGMVLSETRRQRVLKAEQ